MRKNFVKIICTLFVLVTMVIPTSVLAKQIQPIPFTKQSKETYNPQVKHTVFTPLAVTDFDPLDPKINVTVTIKEIRALKIIDLFSDPDFYVKVKINDKEFISDVWQNMKYVEQPNWSASAEVPKDKEFVNVTIELWDKNSKTDRLCDISQDGTGNFTQQRTAELTYSIATGIWWGDDFNGGEDFYVDPSGYGRLSGIDDNSIYQEDRDCELWFNITQNDFDGDGLPYWLETNVYNTSPLIDNRGEDADHDGVPIEWEHTFGLSYIEWGHDQGYYMIYDPFTWENQTALDPDNDGLNNIEEYKTWQWGSDPFRQDIFLEIDQMGKGPNGQGAEILPLETYDLLRDSYARHNIVWHIDDGRLGGGELVPFKYDLNDQDLTQYYWNYFMHNDAKNWRRGVFHWGIIGYNESWAKGFTFASRINGSFALDSFFLSSKYHDSRVKHVPLIDSLIRRTFNSEKQRAMVYAGSIMHETGHSLNIEAPGCDNHDSVWPWQVCYWRYGPYKSVMNYRYVFTDLLDYSDGSRGKNDYNDWGNIDLTNFNPRAHW
jgi:hypothetical protein